MKMGQSNFAEKNDITQRAVAGRNKTEDTKGKDCYIQGENRKYKRVEGCMSQQSDMA